MRYGSDGGAAFPVAANLGGPDQHVFQEGMSLRDYFAGQALANLNLQAHVAKPAAQALAASAYTIADAMLAAREDT
ncbi:MAG: hypothetical protein AB7T31_18300 [Gemmatimonadales bacterium]